MATMYLTARTLHVFLGAFWAGAVFFSVLFMDPAVREAGPEDRTQASAATSLADARRLAVGGEGGWASQAQAWREALARRLTRLYGDQAAMVSALTLARRDGLDPAVREAGPEGGKVMGILQRRGWMTSVLWIGTTTVATGLYLLWTMSGHFSRGFMGSRTGILLSVGALAGMIILAIGLGVSRPTARRMGQVAAKVIINSRTGTVVIGSNVKVSPAAVSHGSLVVTISDIQWPTSGRT